jgi:hypothetical protein
LNCLEMGHIEVGLGVKKTAYVNSL